MLTGLLALLPLTATLALLLWAWRLLADWVGPDSAVGRALNHLGGGTPGNPSLLGYGLGLLIVLAFVYGIGLLVQAGLQQGLTNAINALMQRIPLVRTIYDVMHRLVGLLSQPRDDGLKSMTPVWLHFGGPPAAGETATGVVVLALLTTPEPLRLGHAAYHGVLIPTAPVPVGGGLLYVPAHWVQPADVGIEGLTSIYVSMGVTSSQHLDRYTIDSKQSGKDADVRPI